MGRNWIRYSIVVPKSVGGFFLNKCCVKIANVYIFECCDWITIYEYMNSPSDKEEYACIISRNKGKVKQFCRK